MSNSFARNSQEINNEDHESLSTDNSPIIARADTFGNKNEKVIITRLEVVDGSYKLQSAFIPRFNQKGSVYPFSLIGQYVSGNFDNDNLITFLRFGEKQSFDTFLNCTKNLIDRFPASFINILPRGTEIRINSVDFRRFYYHIVPYLNSLPSVYFGSVSNTGGAVEGIQLVGKSSYQVSKVGSDIVFSLSEGVGITSGFYRNALSGVFEGDSAQDVWRDERVKKMSTVWENSLELFKQDSIGVADTPDFITRIHEGVVGWVSFWIDSVDYDTDDESNFDIHLQESAFGNGAKADLEILSDSLIYHRTAVATEILYDGIDWRKPHRITIRWDNIDQSNRLLTVQLDDLEPKDFQFNTASAALNGFSVNTLRIANLAGTNFKYWGFSQSGDYFPFVYPESNKGYFLPFNLNLMEGITSVTGPNRRDPEGFKNLYSTNGAKTFISGKEPMLSYPEGEFLNLQFMQKGIEVGNNPWVRFLDGSNDGFELKLEWNALLYTIDDHLLDEIDTSVQQGITNFRTSQWITNDWANWWLPTTLSMQIHPKYPDVYIYNAWYQRYIYGFSNFLSLITQIESILTSDPTYENIGDLEYTPLTHPFCHPNNIGFYFGDNVAMPEKFDKCPQRIRKAVVSIEESFGLFNPNVSVGTSIYWSVSGGGGGTFEEVTKFRGSKQLRLFDPDAASPIVECLYTFPIPSSDVPGYYEIEFDMYQDLSSSNGWFTVRVGDNGANRVLLSFLSNTSGDANGTSIPIGFWKNPRQKNHVKIIILNSTEYDVEVNDILYDNGGSHYTSTGFVNPVSKLQFSTNNVAYFWDMYIDNIEANWKVYPNIDNDDFIIYPQYLGHARPIEVVGLDDRWGFRDYGKYTAVPNTHPTKFWVSCFVSATYGTDESNGEIIFYDIAGNEMLYIQIKTLRTAYPGNPANTLTYASDSAETTTALTTLPHSWVGWLPLTIEIDADNSKANIYMHCQLVAEDVDLNGSLEGFGWVSFLNGFLTLPAGSNSIWREEDFQSFGEGTAIGGGAQWTVVAGGTTAFTATIINGDVWGRFLDADGAATLSGVYTFATPSPGTPSGVNTYSIKWEKNISSLTANGLNIRIYDAVPANGEIDMQIRAGGALWNDAGAGFVNTGYTITTVQDIELIVQFVSANTFNIYEDGALVNTGGVLTAKTAWTGNVDILEFRTAANADGADVLIDNIDVSWTEDVPKGSLLVDGIQWSAIDDNGKQFKTYKRCDFRLPYRDYVNPHLSTFHNNLNGPSASDIIELPPYNTFPPDANDPGDTWSSTYWSYDRQTFGSSSLWRDYGAIVHNWYLWKFPYVFGGQYGDFTSFLNKALSNIRLRHTVSDTDKQTIGVWEFVWGGAIDYVVNEFGGECVATFDWNPAIGSFLAIDDMASTNYMIRIMKRDGMEKIEVRIMDDNFPVAVYDNSKELHHYKVEWDVGYIRLYIDSKLVDTRDYNSGGSFFLNYLIFHACAVGGGGTSATSRVYNVVFGAQCSNESNYKEGILDIVSGGTLEQEGATGHLITRNEGTYFINNDEDDWSWEKSHHWKKLALDASGEPDLDNPRIVQNNLIEYGKDGVDFYSLLHNPINRDYKLHTGEQVGPTNTDLETYGKYFSLFTNNFGSDFLQTVMRLFNIFTFTNGYTDDLFDFSILGLSGSISRLLSVYAMQFSQMADVKRDIFKSSLVENKIGFNLDLYFSRFGLNMPIDLNDEKLIELATFLSGFQYPTREVLIDAISLGLGVSEDLVEINEKGSEAEIEIVELSPRGNGVFSSVGWSQYFRDFINKVKLAGVTYTFIFKVFGVSNGVDGISIVQVGP